MKDAEVGVPKKPPKGSTRVPRERTLPWRCLKKEGYGYFANRERKKRLQTKENNNCSGNYRDTGGKNGALGSARIREEASSSTELGRTKLLG